MQRGLTNQQEKQTTEQENEPKDINKQFKKRNPNGTHTYLKLRQLTGGQGSTN